MHAGAAREGGGGGGAASENAGAAVQVAWVQACGRRGTVGSNAHSWTAIEGNPLTLEQVRAVEAGEALPVPARAAGGGQLFRGAAAG